jgi:pimeloyl-ACP methyl ester carboxylesterase
MTLSESSLQSKDDIWRPIVLVHGAAQGGWCWRDVRRHLQAQGFEVFTPTLTGLGERVHLRSPQVTLSTHITDICNVIEWEELTDVLLVGHSYGGMVITGVCDRIKERIGHVVYLDATLPADGESAFPDLTREDMEARFGSFIDGYLVPIGDFSMLGITEDDTENWAWVHRRLTEQLYPCWAESIALAHGGSDGLDRTFVLCTDKKYMRSAARSRLDTTKKDPSWNFIESPKPHDMMITDSKWTASLIAECASGPQRAW